MTKNDYIECITKMLQKLDINVVKKFLIMSTKSLSGERAFSPFLFM